MKWPEMADRDLWLLLGAGAVGCVGTGWKCERVLLDLEWFEDVELIGDCRSMALSLGFCVAGHLMKWERRHRRGCCCRCFSCSCRRFFSILNLITQCTTTQRL